MSYDRRMDLYKSISYSIESAVPFSLASANLTARAHTVSALCAIFHRNKGRRPRWLLILPRLRQGTKSPYVLARPWKRAGDLLPHKNRPATQAAGRGKRYMFYVLWTGAVHILPPHLSVLTVFLPVQITSCIRTSGKRHFRSARCRITGSDQCCSWSRIPRKPR